MNSEANLRLTGQMYRVPLLMESRLCRGALAYILPLSANVPPRISGILLLFKCKKVNLLFQARLAS